MGKRENGQDVREHHHGRGIAWQARDGYIAALGGCLLALSLSGFRLLTQDSAFSQDLAWHQLTAQVALGPRKPGTPEHLKCRDYLSSELKKTCDEVRLQDFLHKWSVTGQDLTMSNIIGEQNWKDAKIRVALFAHWDTRPAAEQDRDPENNKKPIPGANDDASGVAVLLELSRVLKGHLPPGVGVQYVLTDGSDLGPGLDEMFLGATEYARDLANHPKVTYGILVDMVGQKDLKINMEINSAKFARTLLFDLYRHAAEVGLGDVFPMQLGRQLRDDHGPLNAAGLRTIDLIDFDYLAYWHTLSDVPENCSPDSLGKVGKLLQTWLQKDPPFAYEN